MGGGARLVAAGAFLGLIGAAALGKFEASLIYGLRVRDALTFVPAACLIFFVALAASYIPARRASRPASAGRAQVRVRKEEQGEASAQSPKRTLRKPKGAAPGDLLLVEADSPIRYRGTVLIPRPR